MKNVFIRLSSLLMALGFLFCMASCSKTSEYDPSVIVGTWKFEQNGSIRELITEIIDDSSVYTDIYYEFYEDGTGCTYSTMFDDKIEFSYEYDG